MRKPWTILALIGALVASLATARAEVTIRAVMHSDLKIVDPIWTTAYITRNHGYMIYDTLFAMDANGDIRLTDAGTRFARASVDDRKKLFAQHLVTYVPLAGHIKRVLDERAGHRAPASRFRDELEDYMSEEQAQQTLRAIISWARYGEAFAYDESAGAFSLDNPT